MVETLAPDLAIVVEDLRLEIRALAERLARLEGGVQQQPLPQVASSAPPVMVVEKAAVPAVAEPAPDDEITEEILTVISAAVAAFLGVRAHVRQIRLIRSPAWAQQGRVTIQGSHQLR